MGDLMFRDEVYAIQGAIFEVSREVGSGFLEAVYQECLQKEFRLRDIPFVAKPSLSLSYKGEALLQTYQPDLVCFGKIIIELKAVSDTSNAHTAQVLN